MSKYIIDANIFIQAHRKYYPLDVFSCFWNTLNTLAHSQKIISIDKVKNEVMKNNDDLSKWCVQNMPPFFFIDSSPYMSDYGIIINKVNSLNRYKPNALSQFADADIADAFIIATAKSFSISERCIIVTEEVSNPGSISRVKIPDVCNLFDIEYIDTVGMFRELNISF